MERLNRRDAVKVAAVAGLGLASAGTAAGSGAGGEAKAQGDGQSFQPSDGDRAYRVTNRGRNGSALLSNNCEDKKQEIRDRFDCYAFGPCNHPTSADADAYALTVLLPQVLACGGVVNTEFGHKTVRNRVGPITYNTFLSYAAGDQI